MPLKIHESLLQNPEAERTLFSGRARFDLIVYYDQSTKNLESAPGPMIYLKRALESQQLRRPPMMLIGGFDAWQSIVGERGVYVFPPIAHKEKKHWFKSNLSTSSVGSTSSGEIEQHRTLYDYVSRYIFYQMERKKVSFTNKCFFSKFSLLERQTIIITITIIILRNNLHSHNQA